MSAGLLFEWAAGVAKVPVRARARTRDVADPRVAGVFRVQGRECACVLHLSGSSGLCSVDVRDRAERQLQGFDGVGFAQVLRQVREAGVVFDEDAARRVGRGLGGAGRPPAARS